MFFVVNFTILYLPTVNTSKIVINQFMLSKHKSFNGYTNPVDAMSSGLILTRASGSTLKETSNKAAQKGATI